MQIARELAGAGTPGKVGASPGAAGKRALEEVLQVTAPMFDDLANGALPPNRDAVQTLTRRLARRR